MFTPIEDLELRRLMSVSWAFAHDTATLGVFGTSGSDDIRITIIGPEFHADPTADRASQIDPEMEQFRPGPMQRGVSVFEAGTLIFNSLRDGLPVRSVALFGNGKDDALSLATYNSSIAASVYGGDGNDSIYVSSGSSSSPYVDAGDDDDFVQATYALGASSSRIDGGNGNDLLEVTHTYDTAQDDSAIFGSSGDDIIRLIVENGTMGSLVCAGEGDDQIYGSAKDDQLFGQGGNDVIHAGAGNDYLNGGAGDDQLFGEEGDDVLVNSGLIDIDWGTDMLDGGAGFDVAIPGLSDKITDVEEETWVA